KERTGTVFSEGAGLLLLEAAPEASARNADIQAELAGAGVNNNAYHMTHADSEGGGTAVAARMALDDAGIHAGEVDHINSHGTGTELNDKIETRAFKKVFGERMDGISVTTIKGSVGHAMGAASALEAIASVKSIESGVIPPTANYRTPDPDCDVNVVSGKRRRLNPKVVVNNSAGIGGANAAVVFRRPQEE
ncbi:MAG: beta-ketoacyl-[acyl-carrier-protein] synthase family protein, partial [Planctomycetota bacterium]